jgi:hypothetical protein
MMPPPGCVADPHIHRFWIGVLFAPSLAAARRELFERELALEDVAFGQPEIALNERVTTCRCRMMSRMFEVSAIVDHRVAEGLR